VSLYPGKPKTQFSVLKSNDTHLELSLLLILGAGTEEARAKPQHKKKKNIPGIIIKQRSSILRFPFSMNFCNMEEWS
jgi:hypothetical protein